jgi:hypothetical protein
VIKQQSAEIPEEPFVNASTQPQCITTVGTLSKSLWDVPTRRLSGVSPRGGGHRPPASAVWRHHGQQGQQTVARAFKSRAADGGVQLAGGGSAGAPTKVGRAERTAGGGRTRHPDRRRRWPWRVFGALSPPTPHARSAPSAPSTLVRWHQRGAVPPASKTHKDADNSDHGSIWSG